MTHIIPKHYGKVERGEFVPYQLPRWKENLSHYDGKRVYVTINEVKAERTLEQMGYYRAVVVPVAADGYGYDAYDKADLDSVHYAFKWKHLPHRVVMDVEQVVSLADIKDMEVMSRFIDACVRQCAEDGILIPAPNEVEVTK